MVGEDWLYVLGPRVKFLTKDTVGDSYSVLLGAMPPGVVVPLHRHEDRETFYVLHGAVEGFLDGEWLELQSGDVLDIPGNQMHAWRNTSENEVQMIIVTTERLAEFFREVGEPIGDKHPSSIMDRIAALVSAAERYGHYMASPAENEAIGLRVG